MGLLRIFSTSGVGRASAALLRLPSLGSATRAAPARAERRWRDKQERKQPGESAVLVTLSDLRRPPYARSSLALRGRMRA